MLWRQCCLLLPMETCDGWYLSSHLGLQGRSCVLRVTEPKIEGTWMGTNSRSCPDLYCQSPYLFYGRESFVSCLSVSVGTLAFTRLRSQADPTLTGSLLLLRDCLAPVHHLTAFRAKFTVLAPVSLPRNPRSCPVGGFPSREKPALLTFRCCCLHVKVPM